MREKEDKGSIDISNACKTWGVLVMADSGHSQRKGAPSSESSGGRGLYVLTFSSQGNECQGVPYPGEYRRTRPLCHKGTKI